MLVSSDEVGGCVGFAHNGVGWINISCGFLECWGLRMPGGSDWVRRYDVPMMRMKTRNDLDGLVTYTLLAPLAFCLRTRLTLWLRMGFYDL